MNFKLEHISKFRWVHDDSGEQKKSLILNDLCHDYCGNGIHVILGPSGSGKTTLLRLLNRLENQDEGHIYIDGQDIDTIPPRELRQNVSMVFQLPALFRGSVMYNIMFGPRLMRKTITTSKIESLMKFVGLENIEMSRDVDALSVGQQQRIALARALANAPKVLLLDEPTASLDPTASRNLLNMVKKIHADLNISIIIVTHILQHAEQIADSICLLVDGKIVEHGSAVQFFHNPRTEIGRKFISGELQA